MKNITIPLNAIAVAIDYFGDAKNITAVRYYPQKNQVLPQLQLVANPVSKVFGEWRQVGVIRTQANAQDFISKKTKVADRLWVVTNDRRFVEIWVKEDGFVDPAHIQLEIKDDSTASV